MLQEEIESELAPYLLMGTHVPEGMFARFALYLKLLTKWNARTNLTAIRTSQEIVRRHFGESLFAAQHLGDCRSLLDFGSGAGFPGLPIQLVHPEIRVTLAESQGKKATFLLEAVRTLGLTTEVWSRRVEAMPETRQFEIVTLRAVDDTKSAILEASKRASRRIVLLTTSSLENAELAGFIAAPTIAIPGSRRQILRIFNRETDFS